MAIAHVRGASIHIRAHIHVLHFTFAYVDGQAAPDAKPDPASPEFARVRSIHVHYIREALRLLVALKFSENDLHFYRCGLHFDFCLVVRLGFVLRQNYRRKHSEQQKRRYLT